MDKSARKNRRAYERDVRATLLVVREKLREALALSLGRRGGD